MQTVVAFGNNAFGGMHVYDERRYPHQNKCSFSKFGLELVKFFNAS